MVIDPSTLPKGPSLDFLLGKLSLNAQPCSAFTHDKTVTDKLQCTCGRGANQHGPERLTADQWRDLYTSRLGKLRADSATATAVAASTPASPLNDSADGAANGNGASAPASSNKRANTRLRSNSNSNRRGNDRYERERRAPIVKPTKMKLVDFGEDFEPEGGESSGSEATSSSEEETVPDYPEWDEVAPTFASMGLDPRLLEALVDGGYGQATSLQQRVIVPLSTGKNLLVQTGPGISKLNAIAIGALNFVNVDDPATSQVLIFAGGQDAANQLYERVTELGEPLGITAGLIIGGNPLHAQIKKMSDGVHILIATAGRLYDLFKKSHVPSDEIKIVIIDQADSQLSAAFQRTHIFEMLGSLDASVGCAVFYSNYELSIGKLVKKYLPDPVQVIQPTEVPLGLRHSWISVEGNRKLDALLGLDLDGFTEQIVIFANARGCQLVHDALEAAEMQVSAIYGKMDSGERESARKAFAEGITRILIATDSSLESLPITPQVVILFDMPTSSGRYMSRAAACAKGGRVISLVSPRFRKVLRKVEKAVLAAEEASDSEDEDERLIDA